MESAGLRGLRRGTGRGGRRRRQVHAHAPTSACVGIGHLPSAPQPSNFGQRILHHARTSWKLIPNKACRPSRPSIEPSHESNRSVDQWPTGPGQSILLVIMTRIFAFVLLALAVGCDRTPPHARGDLSPYLQWTQGTPVVVHLAATKPSGDIIRGVTARGSLVRATPDALFLADGSGSTNGFDKDLILWAEMDTTR